MKGSLKIWMVILGMVIAGVGITFLTNSYVSRQIEKMAETSEVRKAAAEDTAEEAVLFGQAAEIAPGNSRTAENTDIAESTAEKARAEKNFQEDEAAAEPAAGSNGQAQISAKNAAGEEMLMGEAAEEDLEEGAEAETADRTGRNSDSGKTQTADNVQEDSTLLTEDKTEGVFAEDTAGDGDKKAEAGISPAAGAPETGTKTGGVPSGEEDSAVSARSSSVNISLEEGAEYPADLQEALEEYKERFPKLDAQIEQMRKSETESNVYSVKTSAQTELRIWEREMDGIYRLLCDSLDETAGEELKKEQQEWQQVRDGRAEEAARKNSGGSLESVDYIASVAASNRERAYALLEKYMEE